MIPGKYYVKEIKAPTGYLLSTAIKSFTVLSGKTTAVSVTDIMDISGTVVITKKMVIPEIRLPVRHLLYMNGARRQEVMEKPEKH